MADGYILLYRQIQENPIWTDKPFARGQAWIDLLLMANYADGELFSKGVEVAIQRGQVFRSIGYLSERWGWSEKKVRNFLRYLEGRNMVVIKGTAQGTLITIEKYASFQCQGRTDYPTEDIAEYRAEGIATTDKRINNNNNNTPTTIECASEADAEQISNASASDTKPKPKKASRFTPPTREEVRAYCEEKELVIDPDYFWEYYESDNWLKGNSRNSKKEPMRNWKQTMISWNKRELERNPEKAIKKNQSFDDGLDILFGGM